MHASDIEGEEAAVPEPARAVPDVRTRLAALFQPDSPDAAASPNDDDRTRVIILLVRTAYWLIVGSMAALSLIDFVTASPFYRFGLVTRLLTLMMGGAILLAGLRKVSMRSTAVAVLSFCAVLLGSTLWQVSFTHDPFATPLAAVGLTLVAAWSLPWPIGYQVALGALGALAIVVNGAVTERVYDDMLVPLLLTVGSIPMAMFGSRQRSALAVARREAQQAGEQLHRIAENADEVLWVLDLASGSLTYISPGVESLCGVSAEAIRQRLDLFIDLVHPDDRERVAQQITASRAMNESARIDHRIRRPDGTLRWVQLRLSPIHDDAGKVVRLGGVIRDTTAEWELATAQRRAREEAEATARLKDQFLANMSHEIRTPLNGVIGMVDLLRESSLAPAQRAHVDTIHACGKQLLSLVNDLLDFSKIEAGRVEVARVEFDLGQIVAYVVQLFGPRAAEKGLDLSYAIEMPPFAAFRGDPDILRQILTNLVANAVKFTETGHVIVRAGVAEDVSEHVLLQFQVEDTGIGVAPASQSVIFEPFVQADTSTARQFAGTGLGLAIAQRLTRLLGGEIQFRSTLGSGSTFWFTARVEQPRTDAADDQGLPKKRVLVAVEKPEARACVSAELTGWALRVHQVASIADAGAAIAAAVRRAEPYDLVIADTAGSGMTALEFVRGIRQMAGNAPPAIGLLSLGGRPGDGPAACDAGAAFYLPVPARPLRLYECLRELWESSAATGPPVMLHAPRRILIVEDNVLNQRVAVAMVERVGHRATVVASGKEALEALETEPYDAVLMDCQLPEMDGFETTLRIRARERGTSRRMPVIALTASATQAARERCLAAGMDDYLTKPIQSFVLGEMLMRWTGDKEAAATGGAAPPIDRVRLYELTSNDPAQIERYAQMFHDEITWGLGEMLGGATDGDAGRVLAALHRLKGAAASVGAVGVLDILSHLEDDTRASGSVHARRGAADLAQAYREFSEALKIP